MNDLTTKKPNELLDLQAQRIVEFLADIGLPHDNIIADQSQRKNLGTFQMAT